MLNFGINSLNKIKKSFQSIIIISILCASSTAWSGYKETLLVLDMQNTAELPRNFRISKVNENEPTLDWRGFANLHIAGGGEFSQQALQQMMQALPVKHFTIIDLRRESHGLLNGSAISWYGPHNAANEDKTPQAIEADQSQRLEKIRQVTKIDVNDIVEKSPEEIIEKVNVLSYPVQAVHSEAELAQQMHLNYARVYVADFHAPTTAEVDRFLAIIKTLPADEWIYFHCRAGVGRTTTFMAMYDMLRNAKIVSFEQILKRQAAIGGKSLTDLPADNPYKYPLAVERLQFLQKFYEYARTNDDDFQTSWSDWLREHN